MVTRSYFGEGDTAVCNALSSSRQEMRSLRSTCKERANPVIFRTNDAFPRIIFRTLFCLNQTSHSLHSDDAEPRLRMVGDCLHHNITDKLTVGPSS